jgi:hypothetical protein
MPNLPADTYLLVPLVALGLVAIGLGVAIRYATRFAARQDRRLAAAKPANARIMRVGKSYTYKDDPHVCVFLELQVHPHWGRSFETGSAWKIEPARIKELQAGQTYRVKVDAAHPETVFPDVPWAEYDWLNEDVTNETKLR